MKAKPCGCTGLGLSIINKEIAGQARNDEIMTSKQRAHLISLANSLDPVIQIGKSSLTPEVTEAINEAFNNRELIKISVLKNCFEDPKVMAETIAERTHSEVVKVIGKKIVLYKPHTENPKILLPN